MLAPPGGWGRPEPMVEKYDIPSRLAEGSAAVENLQRYVWACRLLGYQHPDLTVHAAQLRDWYGSEDGMDLGALHGDCLGLEAAVRPRRMRWAFRIGSCRRCQRCGRARARTHPGTSCVATAKPARLPLAAVRTAAEALGALRDELWRAVDAKVGAVVAVEDRTHADRAAGLPPPRR